MTKQTGIRAGATTVVPAFGEVGLCPREFERDCRRHYEAPFGLGSQKVKW